MQTSVRACCVGLLHGRAVLFAHLCSCPQASVPKPSAQTPKARPRRGRHKHLVAGWPRGRLDAVQIVSKLCGPRCHPIQDEWNAKAMARERLMMFIAGLGIAVRWWWWLGACVLAARPVPVLPCAPLWWRRRLLLAHCVASPSCASAVLGFAARHHSRAFRC